MVVIDKAMKALIWLASAVAFGSTRHSDWVYEIFHKPTSVYIMSRNVINYVIKKPALYKLVSVSIEPVFGCNLQCTYCGLQTYEARGGESPVFYRPYLMEWDLYQYIIDQLPSSVESISLYRMGEPLLHPQITDMIDYAASKGFRVIIFTNGTLLDEDMCKRLAKTKLNVLNVSVEPDQETGIKYRGIQLDEIIQKVAYFNTVKPKHMEVKISLVVHEGNMDRFGGVDQLWAGIVSKKKIIACMDYDENYTRDSCFEPWRGNLNFLTSGDVTPCCIDSGADLIIGNIRDNTIEEILAGRRYKEILDSFCSGHLLYRCEHCTELQTPLTVNRFIQKFKRR